MDPETRFIHSRLEAWGRWAHGAETQGFPAVTLVGRMIKWGPQGASQTQGVPITMPDEIAVVDAAVARLEQPEKQTVIAYYTRWEPVEVLALRFQMKERQVRRVLQRARWKLGA